MSDHFGIGNAMRGMALTYFQSARATGRTTSLVESLKDGDRVWFVDYQQAKRVEDLCKERGVKVECLICHPHERSRMFERGPAEGRTILDHRWLEDFYMRAIEEGMKEIDYLEQQTSGVGEPHRETRRKAMEISKWHP